MERPRYATWIRKKKIALFWLLGAGVLAVSGVAGLLFAPLFFIALAAIPFLYIALIISLAAYRFSPRGGDFQNKIHELVIGATARSGDVLDVGCGGGNLLIKLAKANSGDSWRGIDFWGTEWEYSKAQCETNARLEGISDIEFEKASASKLPFSDSSISNVVSCLTFHEVLDVDDKTLSLAEALRVLKAGGTFTFFDLFADPAHFVLLDKVLEVIRGAGGTISTVVPLSKSMRLPFPLDTAHVLKHAVLIAGRKNS